MIYKRILSQDEKSEMLISLRVKWDISNDYYWYPLYDSQIKDIMSFYISDEAEINLSNVIKHILFDNNIDYLFEFIEYGGSNDDIEFQATNLAIEFRPYERFWCDKTLNWLIYLTHEGYITLGGKMLIDGVKKYINNCEEYEVKI